MPLCIGLAVARDANDEAIRDILTGLPLMRPCRGHALKGTDPPKCITHCTPQERQIRKQKNYIKNHVGDISSLMTALDIENQNPMDGLLEVVRLSGTMMRMFQVLVRELAEAPYIETILVSGELVDIEKPGIWGHDHNADQSEHVLMGLLNLWTDRFMRSCKMALDAGIDERIVRNAETTSNTLLVAFDRALKTVNLTEVQRIAINQAMAREIRDAVSPSPVLQLEDAS
jgi:hypothetical protein